MKYMLLFIKNEETDVDEADRTAHYAAIDEWFAEMGLSSRARRTSGALRPSMSRTWTRRSRSPRSGRQRIRRSRFAPWSTTTTCPTTRSTETRRPAAQW